MDCKTKPGALALRGIYISLMYKEVPITNMGLTYILKSEQYIIFLIPSLLVSPLYVFKLWYF